MTLSDTVNLSKRELQAMKTREDLLKAGRTIFLENGYKKATMTQVNKLANTGYGTAYIYFKNKDVLFVEVMESTMKKMYNVAGLEFEPKKKRDALEQIKEQAVLFMNLALEEKEMMRVVNEAIGISAIVRERWDKIRSRFIDEITEDIKFVQKVGLAKGNLNASLIAKGWFYMNEQLMWDLVLDKIDEDVEEIAKHLSDLYTSGLYK